MVAPPARRPRPRAARGDLERVEADGLGVSVRLRSHGGDRGHVSGESGDLGSQKAARRDAPVVARRLQGVRAPSPPTRRPARGHRTLHGRARARPRREPTPAAAARCGERSFAGRDSRVEVEFFRREVAEERLELEAERGRSIVGHRGEREHDEAASFGDALREREVPGERPQPDRDPASGASSAYVERGPQVVVLELEPSDPARQSGPRSAACAASASVA